MRQPRTEYRKLARIAEYTAQLARKLADPDADLPESDGALVRGLRASLKREQAQFEVIMRYLSRAKRGDDYAEVDMLEHGVAVRRYTSCDGLEFTEDKRLRRMRGMDVGETRRALSEYLLKQAADDSPDWIGSALCDLNLCRTEKDFRLWIEENGLTGAEDCLVYEKERAR